MLCPTPHTAPTALARQSERCVAHDGRDGDDVIRIGRVTHAEHESEQ